MSKLHLVDTPAPRFDLDNYIIDEGLQNAIEVAYALHQPLLITGEPGTGKTRLAYKIAHDLSTNNGDYHFLSDPFVFNTKTTSTAKDLFYSYDALRHFQASNLGSRNADLQKLEISNYISLQALGLAIAQTQPDVDKKKFNNSLVEAPCSSVILIDEVDKAPRDFTNDLLNEIENREFFIQEQNNYLIRKSENQRIFIILTSNSEKNLPDAFLRRCVFYHIPFPDSYTLKKIIQNNLGGPNSFSETFLDYLIETFFDIRKKAIRKPPATAELLAWIHILGLKGIENMNEKEQKQQILSNLSVLIKTKEDLESVRSII